VTSIGIFALMQRLHRRVLKGGSLSWCGGVCPHFASFSALGLVEGSMSTSVHWWAHTSDAPSPMCDFMYNSAAYSGVAVLRSQSNRPPMSGNPR
jgi:hypothetical protein